jgi:hypothetical protein
MVNQDWFINQYLVIKNAFMVIFVTISINDDYRREITNLDSNYHFAAGLVVAVARRDIQGPARECLVE